MSMFMAKAKTAALILAIGGATMAVSMKAAGVGIAGLAPTPANVEAKPAANLGSTDDRPPVPQAAGSAPTPASPAVPPADRATRPMQSTVRITVPGPGGVTIGPGTIIASTLGESIILTNGSIFERVAQSDRPSDAEVPPTIEVDVYEWPPLLVEPKIAPGVMIDSKPVPVESKQFSGTLIDFDLRRNLGLIRIRPGRQLPVSRVVPPGWIPGKGMHMRAVGCPEGTAPTAFTTMIMNPRMSGIPSDSTLDKAYVAIECSFGPKQKPGRSGGGLYTDDGYMAGVGIASELYGSFRYYIHPATIHEFLDRNGLKGLYAAKPPMKQPDPSFAIVQVDERVPPVDPPTPKPAADEVEAPSPVGAMPHPNVIDPPSTVPPSPANSDAEPPYLPPDLPRIASKPWETVVRIRILGEASVGFGSGTVISSNPGESLILTSGHHFRLDGKPQAEAANFPARIIVDTFSGKLEVRTKAATVGEFSGTWPGKLIACDLKLDLALVKIRPGRKLPASRIGFWYPVGQMVTAGCSEGKDPTIWSTQVINPRVRGLAGNPDYEAVECTTAPKQGRSGGGLFTESHELVGVCNYAQLAGDRGLYATTRSIHKFLARAGYASLLEMPASPSEPWMSRAAQKAATDASSSVVLQAPTPSVEPKKPSSPAVEDRLRDVEQKLERLIRLMERKDAGSGERP